MTPTLDLRVMPDPNSDYGRVVLAAAVTDEHGVVHDVILYDQLRLIQPLPVNCGIELWAVTTFANITNVIESALHARIAQGAITLMANGGEQQRH